MKILLSRRSLAVVAGIKTRMTTQNRQKSNAKKRGVHEQVVYNLSACFQINQIKRIRKVLIPVV
mgnify:CR=1 FL=1